MILRGKTYTEKKEAGAAIIELCRAMTTPDPVQIGQYRGFTMELYFDPLARDYRITLIHDLRHIAAHGTDIYGNIQRLDNVLDSFNTNLNACQAQLENTKSQMETAKIQVEKPFPYEEDFQTKSARIDELNATLDKDKHENEIADSDFLETSQESTIEQTRYFSLPII